MKLKIKDKRNLFPPPHTLLVLLSQAPTGQVTFFLLISCYCVCIYNACAGVTGQLHETGSLLSSLCAV